VTNLKEKIKNLAASYSDNFIDVRHHLHQNPELSYQEFKTSEYIRERLNEYGIASKVMAQTGVIATIEGKNPSKRVVYQRAQIDAITI
jgi:hippurate hydrolase